MCDPLLCACFDNFPEVAVHIVESPRIGAVCAYGREESSLVVQRGLRVAVAEQAPVGEIGVGGEHAPVISK